MPLLGRGALAMWWDIEPAIRAVFQDWHSREHFPERLALPGFRRASRWHAADGGEGVFVLYESRRHADLASPAYLERLGDPTPWSTRIMPHHRNMVRCQCRVVASHGVALTARAITVRIRAGAGGAAPADMSRGLSALVAALPGQPGVVGAHLLAHEDPVRRITAEQRLRGPDQVADWVVVACAYDADAAPAVAAGFAERLVALLGADAHAAFGMYSLGMSALRGETR